MEKMQHFSIRKLSIGAASVLIGISFLGVKASTVKADSLQNTSATELTKSKAANEAIKQDTGSNIEQEPTYDIKKDTSSNIKKDTSSNIKQDTGSNIKQDTGSDIKQEPVSKTDAKQINNDQPNADQTPAQPVTSKPNSNQQNAADLEAKPQTPVKDKLQTNSVIIPDKAGQSKVKTTNLMAIAGKKLNAQMLSESKVASPAKDTNGGFDEATWGKLNVNDWKGNIQGDYYQLTDYTGDANHVIVPNEADFTKAGISTSGKQVGVTSDLMRTIFKNKDTATDATVAFSKTDNKQVKAIGNDWSVTWYSMYDGKLSKFDGTNIDVSNVTDMSYMFYGNQINDLSTLANWNVSNVTNMDAMFYQNQISDLNPLANWKVSNVTNMNGMFSGNQISDLSPLANWKVSNVTNMGAMFSWNTITDLNPLANWKVDNVTAMIFMFYHNQISDVSPLANWNVAKVTNIRQMFDANSSTQTTTVQAKLIINFVYPANYLGKKQNSITQTVDVPTKQVQVELTTKDSKPSNNILDWVTKTETPISTPTDPVYFQDYTVPEIKGLLEPDQTVISKQQADITKPINVTVTYKLVESNTNDAFALDPKNGLHEHANVNNNGGYDEDYWGKLNVNDWNYTTNGDTITITGYKGNNHSSLIIPNGADFDLANGQGAEQSNVEISSSVMHDLAKNATRIGLSKTANKKIVASDANWQDAFGGLTNEPGTDSNAYGGIKYGSPNLTQMDLHNLDTTAITSISALFNGGSNLTTVGDLSDWNTRNVTSMRTMFQSASNLTNIGNLDNWDTSQVTDMSWMFSNTTNLTNIGDLSKWQTGNVTDMSRMFAYATNLTNIGNLDNWDTSKVTSMQSMFSNATNLTNIGNLDNWDTSKVTDMRWMFGTESGKQSHLTNIGDLSKWQTGNVTDMSRMFFNATNLTNIGNLDNWDTSKVTSMQSMFSNATNLTNIGNLDNWDTSKVTDMRWMFGTESGKQSHLTNIGDLSKWQTSNVTDMSFMFANAANLTNLGDLSKWNTSKVTDMHWMFGGTTNLTNIGNLDNWDTSKVTDMRWMFGTESGKQSHLTNIGDLSKWQTGNVTDMSFMFANAANLTNLGDLSKWNTSKVTDMHWMFGGTTNLTNIGNLDNWDTSQVTNMMAMFQDATNLTNIGDLSKWQTGNVANMAYMFTNAINLTNIGNLSKWNTSKVTNMLGMFGDTNALRHLNISNWNLTKLANKDSMQYMFTEDPNLTVIANDLKLPTWYENEVNNADYFWNNHIAVITNVPELIKATGDINNLKIDDQDASRSIFYDSKGSSDAVQVLKDANNQYIADYHKVNPTKVLKLADTVDQNDPIALANASFITVPAAVGLTVHFEDVDPNANKDSDTVKQELAKTVELSGRSDDTADLSQVQLPTNFELSGDLPSATFGDTDSVTIKLKHKIAYIDPIYGQTYNYSNMTDEEKQMAFKQLTYHLIVNGPDGEHDFGPTGFTLIHMLERDLVTGKSKLYDGEDGALKNGTYMKSGWSAVLGDFKDDTAEDLYESANKLFNDPSTKLNTSMDMFRFEYNMMDHYSDDKYRMRSFGPVIDDMTTISLFAIGHDVATLHSYYLHKMNPDMDDEDNVMMPEVMINSIVPQNYHIEVPSFIKQESYDWSGNKGTYYTLTDNDGFGLALQVGDDNSVLAHLYTPSNQDMHVVANPVLDFPENYTIRLNVVPNEQKSSYYFVDDNSGAQVGDPVEIKGKTDETVTINPVLPNNYEVVGKLPTSYTFTNTKDPNKAVIEQGAYSVHTSPLVIHLKHKTETSVESLPATRTINVHLPNGTTKVYEQIIGYQRDVITDLVTQTVTRGTWTVNDVISSFTIDGVKQLEHSYVLRNGNYKFASIKLPKVPGYKAFIKTVPNPINPTNSLFIVSFMALPKPVKLTPNDVEPAKTVTPATTETAELIKTEPKVTTSVTPKIIDLSDAIVATIPKTIDLSNDAVATTPDVSTWQIANEPERDTYRVSNGKYTVELPYINNTQLHILVNNSTKDSVLFTYKGQNTKYVFNIKFANGHYLLTTYEIKSDKLVKLIDYNFVKSSKMSDLILDWLKLK